MSAGYTKDSWWIPGMRLGIRRNGVQDRQFRYFFDARYGEDRWEQAAVRAHGRHRVSDSPVAGPLTARRINR